MIWEEWKAKFRKFSENLGYFRKPHIMYFFVTIFLAQVLAQLYMNSKKIYGAEKLRDSPWLIFPFCDEIF
jgi:hypothetical protein